MSEGAALATPSSVRQDQAEKFAQGERIGRSPRDGALGVQALEIPDQQQPEVPPGRQTRSTVAGVEALAQPFHVSVEVVLIEELIQPLVEGMRGTARQVLGR